MAKQKTRKAKAKKRSVRTRVVTKVRRVKSKAKKFSKKRGKSIVSTISNIVPSASAIHLLTFNQLAEVGENASMGLKLKAVANGMTGSLFGQNFFSDAPKAYLNFDIEGMFNQWTALGVGAWVAGSVGRKFGLPKSGMIKSFGKKLVVPALVAGTLGKSNNVPNQGNGSPFLNQSSQSQTFARTSIQRTSIANDGSVI